MEQSDLTDTEYDLLRRLPGPPPITVTQSTNVWIIEWLFQEDQKTGNLLHHWMQERRPGWSAYLPCKDSADVFAAIQRATVYAERSRMIPILHIEAHGDEIGLGGPDGSEGSSLITWDELAQPLQRLNLMTRCNLGVFVAACTGFAAIMTFTRGPRAPAAWLVGPDSTIIQADLLSATKEFYRHWIDKDPRLSEIAASASRETEPVVIEPESFALLAFESLAQFMIVSMRPRQLRQHIQGMRCYLEETGVVGENNGNLRSITAVMLQNTWDRLFMIDLYPENRERFGVNVPAVLEMVLAYHEASVDR